MFRWILACTLVALVAASGSCAKAATGTNHPPESFGDEALAEILLTAAQNNPNISAATERINQAREDVHNATAARGPSLVVGGAARRNDGRSYGGKDDAYNASLNLMQTLYAGGTLAANRNAADLGLKAVTAEGVRTYQDVLNEARTNYYNCLRALARMQVAIEALNLSQEHLMQAESLFRGGMAPRGDVLRVQVSVSQAELDLVRAQSDLDESWVALEQAVGAKLLRQSILKPLSSESTDALTPPPYPAPRSVVARALAQRPEVEAYTYYGKRADYLVKSAAGRQLPQVSLSGRLNADRDAVSLTNDEWYVQLEMQWTLFDGGANASGVRKAKAAARELLHQLENVSAQVGREAAQAEIRLQSALTRLELAAEQTATSREDYRLALRRYDAQMGTNLDVLDARRALIDSRTSYVDAVYDIAVAQCGLVHAMGEDRPTEALFGDTGDSCRF